MDGKVDICNRALAYLGQEPITALADETEAARRCRLFYDPAREETLRAHDWGFALRTSTLALKRKKADGAFVYAYPQDALYVRSVFGAQSARAAAGTWEAAAEDGERVIVCEFELAWALYVANEINTERFDPLFKRALALALATDLAVTLTADHALSARMAQMHAAALDEARRANMTERKEVHKAQSAFVEAR